MDLETYEALGLHRAIDEFAPGATINGRSNREIMGQLETEADRQYHPNPEAFPNEGTPRGTVTSFRRWSGTKVYPDTVRDLWIYKPAGFDKAGAAPAVMIFNDGGAYLDRNGPVRAAAVFDTLTAAGEVAPTIGVFVMPGQREGTPNQRSIEYDSVTETYGRFLTDDLLPFVESELGCRLSDEPKRRTVCGISSGGICAFTAAWYRPEVFGRVLSHCGSFTAIRGGHNYPYLIRSTPRKPIRVWMQSGAKDADIITGSWPEANHAVASSLAFAGYDHKFVFGEGAHNLRQGGATFADALRWLWRD